MEETVSKLIKVREELQNKYNEQAMDRQNSPKILDVKYVGKVNFKNIGEKELFMIIEEIQNGEDEKIVLEKYFTEDLDLVAANNRSDGFDLITLTEAFLEEEDLVKDLNSIDEEELLSLDKVEKDKLKSIAKALGINEEEIEKLTEIEEPAISEEKMEGLNLKQEIQSNERVTDQMTMQQLLGVEDKNYSKIAVVYSSDIGHEDSNMKFSMVGIDKEGKAEKIEGMEQVYGNDPTKKVEAINRDGSEITEEVPKAIYQLDGENQLGITIGQYGYIDVSYIRTPRQDNQEAISIPIEANHIMPTTREVQEFMNRNRNEVVNDNIQNLDEQKKALKETSLSEFDENQNNARQHIEFNEQYVEKIVEQILRDSDLGDTYNRHDIRERVREDMNCKLQENEMFDSDSIKEEVQAEMENDSENEVDRSRSRNRDSH